MIEKVMRAVKSSNKKRGRNITIGAVVGILLSCTAVMGADDYLWIRNNNGVIEFSTIDNNTGGDWKGNPYLDNSWNGKTYTNNIILSGSNSSGSGYGLKLSGNLGENFNLVNNGIISGSGSNSNSGYGVYSLNSTLRDIGNIGIIAGTNYGVYLYFDSSSNTTVKSIANNGIISGSNGYGVRLYSSSSSNITVESIVNTGIISGTSSNGPGHGVRLYSDSSSNTTVESMANNGIISGTGSSIGYGVFLNSTSSSNTTVESIVNTGIISGTGGSGYGVDLYSASTVKSIVNKGIIYGSTNAIYNNGGKITEAHNYGLLVNGKDDKVIKGLISGVQNYGLIFNAVGDEYTIDDTFGNNFGKKSEEDGYTVINVKVGLTSDPSGKKIDNNEIKSLKLTDGELSYYDLSEGLDTLQKENIDLNKKYILNGITDTLLVSTGDNRLNNSVINAYGNAVKFDETNGGELTLIGTVVNGGLKNPNDPIKANRTYAIKGSDKADTLTLQGKTVINGNIAMGTGADTLNIGNGVQINGILDGGTNALSDATTENDTLNFGVASNVKTTSSNEEIRILHNISNFENININSNVTFYESTIDTAGKIESLKVTGVENLTIGENGVLTLRIDSTKKDDLDTNKIIGHALYGAVTTVTSLALGTGTSISSTGGKLVLALNGAVENNIIDFGTTGLDMSTFVTREEGTYKEDVTLDTTSALHSVETYSEAKSSGILINKLIVTAKADLPMYNLIPEYEKLNEIYHSIISVKGLLGNFNVEKDEDEDMSLFLSYLNDIYAGNPYSYSSELSRKSTGMFRDRVTENQFKPNLNNWLIYGGLTHIDGGTKDTYYGKGYYTYDIGSSDIEADTKITGAYMLGEYGVSETLTSGVIIGGNKLKSDLFNGSKVDGDALYVGAYAKKYMGNLKVTAGAGFQYGDYDADRMAVNRVASSTGESVTKYSSNYNDITYDIYLNGRYSNPIGDNLFLEPYGTLSYTYIKQDGANEGNKTLAIETDSKSFDYTVGKVGVDLKKVIPHSTGKSTLTAGVSYTKIFDGAEEEYITGRFKGGTDFDILVAHKNQHSIGLNAKYALELENGVLFDVKGTYSVERDSHNNSGKNKTKGEWIVGAGLGYKF